MNMFERAHITFTLLALFIILHTGQVVAPERNPQLGGTRECTYHFSPDGKVKGRASCMADPDHDYSCETDTCLTQYNHGYDNFYYYGCHRPDVPYKDSIQAVQYFRRKDDGYASVQDARKQLFWDCNFNAPNAPHNNQYLICDGCYAV
ncbi:hypothetical protein PGT21_003273 [Puccinia graminis f. sp. tritici]|nr:hypothetical protein PGT21_003273 [Puccinia graminis f. sp. tritici]